MKYTSIILIFFLILISCSSQTDKSNGTIKSTPFERISGENSWGFIDNHGDTIIPLGKYKFLNPIDEVGMIFAQLNGKYGFIDINQNAVIPFVYDDLSVFSEGLAPAKKDGKWGYINRKGEVVITFQFDKERHFYKTGLSEASRDGKWGFINKKGKEVVPIKYAEVDCHKMEEELIFVCSKNKWAIFDKNGKQQSGFIYDEIYGTSNNFDYFDKEYLYNELLLVRKGNQFRYINRDIDIVADFSYYEEAEPITEFGFAIVKKGGLYGVINSKNEPVIPFEFSFIDHPRRPYQDFYDEFYIHQNGKVGILNEKAELIADVIYDSFERDYSEIDDSKQVIFRAKKDNHYGIINKKGEITLPIEYEEIGLFKGDNISTAKKNGLFGIIDSYGNIKLPFEYNSITSYKGWDYFILQKKDDYGVIDKKSLCEILPLEYQYMEQCHYGNERFIVKKNGHYGVITRGKEVIIPIEYDVISNWVEYGPDEHFIVKNRKHGLISREGEIVIPPMYDKLYVDNSILIKVQNDGLWGTINWENEIVHPIEYEKILWEWPYLTGQPIDTIYIEKSGKYFATDINGKVINESVSDKVIDEKFGYLMN